MPDQSSQCINSCKVISHDTSSDTSAVTMPSLLPVASYSAFTIFPAQVPDPYIISHCIQKRILEIANEKTYQSPAFNPDSPDKQPPQLTTSASSPSDISNDKDTKLTEPCSYIRQVPDPNIISPCIQKRIPETASEKPYQSPVSNPDGVGHKEPPSPSDICNDNGTKLPEPCAYISIDDDDDPVVCNIDNTCNSDKAADSARSQATEPSTIVSCSKSHAGSQLIDAIIKEKEIATLCAYKADEVDSKAVESVQPPSSTLTQSEIDQLYKKLNKNSFPWLDLNHTRRFKYLLRKRLANRKLCDTVTDGLKRKQVCELLDEVLTPNRLQALYFDGYLAKDPHFLVQGSPIVNAEKHLSRVEKERLQWFLDKNLISKNYHEYLKKVDIKNMTSELLSNARLKQLFEQGYLLRNPRLVPGEVMDEDTCRRGRFFQTLFKFLMLGPYNREIYKYGKMYLTEYMPYRYDEVRLAAEHAVHKGVPTRDVLGILDRELMFKNTTELKKVLVKTTKSDEVSNSSRKRTRNRDIDESPSKKLKLHEKPTPAAPTDTMVLEDVEEKETSDICLAFAQKVHHTFTAQEQHIIADLNLVQKHRLQWLLDHELLGKKYFKYLKRKNVNFITKARLTVKRLWVLFTLEWLIRDPAFLFDEKGKRSVAAERTNFSSSIYGKGPIISHSKYCQKLYRYIKMKPQRRCRNCFGIKDYLIEYTPYRLYELICTVKYALSNKHSWSEISSVLSGDGLVQNITDLEIKVFGIQQPITENALTAPENSTGQNETSIPDDLKNGSDFEIEDIGAEEDTLDPSLFLKPRIKPHKREATKNKMQLMVYKKEHTIPERDQHSEDQICIIRYEKLSGEELDFADTTLSQTDEQIITDHCKHLNETQKDRIRWLLRHNLLGKKCYTYLKPDSWRFISSKTISMFRLWDLYRSKKIIRYPGCLFKKNLPLDKQKILLHSHESGCNDAVAHFYSNGSGDQLFRKLLRYLKGQEVAKVRNYMLDYAPYRYNDLVAAVKAMTLASETFALTEVSKILEEDRLIGRADEFERDVDQLQHVEKSCDVCRMRDRNENDSKDSATCRQYLSLDLEDISDDELPVLPKEVTSTSNVLAKETSLDMMNITTSEFHADVANASLVHFKENAAEVMTNLESISEQTSEVPANAPRRRRNPAGKRRKGWTDIQLPIISADANEINMKLNSNNEEVSWLQRVPISTAEWCEILPETESNSTTLTERDVTTFSSLTNGDTKLRWLVEKGFLSERYKRYFYISAMNSLTACNDLFSLWSSFKRGFLIRDPTAKIHTNFHKLYGSHVYKFDVNTFMQKLDIFLQSILQNQNHTKSKTHVKNYLSEYIPYRRIEVIAYLRDRALGKFDWTGISYVLAHVLPQEALYQTKCDLYGFKDNVDKVTELNMHSLNLKRRDIFKFVHLGSRYKKLKWLVENGIMSENCFIYFNFDQIASLLGTCNFFELWSSFKEGLLVKDATIVFSSEKHNKFRRQAGDRLDAVNGNYIYKTEYNIFLQKLNDFVRSKLQPNHSADTASLKRYLIEYIPYRRAEVLAFLQHAISELELTNILSVMAEIMHEKYLAEIKRDLRKIMKKKTSFSSTKSIAVQSEQSNMQPVQCQKTPWMCETAANTLDHVFSLGNLEQDRLRTCRKGIDADVENDMQIVPYFASPWINVNTRDKQGESTPRVNANTQVVEIVGITPEKQNSRATQKNWETIDEDSVEEEEMAVLQCLNDVQRDRLRWLLAQKLLTKLYYKLFSIKQIRVITSKALCLEELWHLFRLGFLLRDPEFLFKTSLSLDRRTSYKRRTPFSGRLACFLRLAINPAKHNSRYYTLRSYMLETVPYRSDEVVRLLRSWIPSKKWNELSHVLENELTIRNVNELKSRVYSPTCVEELESTFNIILLEKPNPDYEIESGIYRPSVTEDIGVDESNVGTASPYESTRIKGNDRGLEFHRLKNNGHNKNNMQLVPYYQTSDQKCPPLDLPGKQCNRPRKETMECNSMEEEEIAVLQCLNELQKDRLGWLLEHKLLSKLYYKLFPLNQVRSLTSEPLSLEVLWHNFHLGLLSRDPELLFETHLQLRRPPAYRRKTPFSRKLNSFLRLALKSEDDPSCGILRNYMLETVPYRPDEVVRLLRSWISTNRWRDVSRILEEELSIRNIKELESRVYWSAKVEDPSIEAESSFKIFIPGSLIAPVKAESGNVQTDDDTKDIDVGNQNTNTFDGWSLGINCPESNCQDEKRGLDSTTSCTTDDCDYKNGEKANFHPEDTLEKHRDIVVSLNDDMKNAAVKNDMRIVLYAPPSWRVSDQNNVLNDSRHQRKLPKQAKSETREFDNREEEEINAFRCLNEVQRDRLRWLLEKQLLNKTCYKYFTVTILRSITSTALNLNNLRCYYLCGFIIRNPEFLFETDLPLEQLTYLPLIERHRRFFSRTFNKFVDYAVNSKTALPSYKILQNYLSENVTHRLDEVVKLLRFWSTKHPWSTLSRILEQELSVRKIQYLGSRVFCSAIAENTVVKGGASDERSNIVTEKLDNKLVFNNSHNDAQSVVGFECRPLQSNRMQIVPYLPRPWEALFQKNLLVDSRKKHGESSHRRNSKTVEFETTLESETVFAGSLNELQRDRLRWLLEKNLISKSYYRYFSESELKTITSTAFSWENLWSYFGYGFLMRNPEFLFETSLPLTKLSFLPFKKSQSSYRSETLFREKFNRFFGAALRNDTKTYHDVDLRNYVSEYVTDRYEELVLLLRFWCEKFTWNAMSPILENELCMKNVKELEGQVCCSENREDATHIGGEIDDIASDEAEIISDLGHSRYSNDKGIDTNCMHLVPYVPCLWNITKKTAEQTASAETNEDIEFQLPTEGVSHLSELEKDRLRWLLNEKLLSVSFHKYFSAAEVKYITKYPLTLYVLWFLFEYGYIVKEPGFLFEASICVGQQRAMARKLFGKYNTNQFRRKFGSYLGLSMKTSNNALNNHRTYVLEYAPHRYEATISYLKQYRVFTKHPWEKISSILQNDGVIVNISDLEVSPFGSNESSGKQTAGQSEIDKASQQPFTIDRTEEPELDDDAPEVSGEAPIVVESENADKKKSKRGRKPKSKKNARKRAPTADRNDSLIKKPKLNENSSAISNEANAKPKSIENPVKRLSTTTVKKETRGRKPISAEIVRKRKIHKYLESLKRKMGMTALKAPIVAVSPSQQEPHEEDDVFEEFRELDNSSCDTKSSPKTEFIDCNSSSGEALTVDQRLSSEETNKRQTVDYDPLAARHGENVSDIREMQQKKKSDINDFVVTRTYFFLDPSMTDTNNIKSRSKTAHFKMNADSTSARVNVGTKLGFSKTDVIEVEDSDSEPSNTGNKFKTTLNTTTTKKTNETEDVSIVIPDDSDAEENSNTTKSKTKNYRSAKNNILMVNDSSSYSEASDNFIGNKSRSKRRTELMSVSKIEYVDADGGSYKTRAKLRQRSARKPTKKLTKDLVVKIENAEKMIRKALSKQSSKKPSASKKAPPKSKKSNTDDVKIINIDSSESGEEIIKEVETFLKGSEKKRRKRKLVRGDRKLENNAVEPKVFQNDVQVSPAVVETVKAERKRYTLRVRSLEELTSGSTSRKRELEVDRAQEDRHFNKKAKTGDNLPGISEVRQSDEVVIINGEVVSFR
ncbi:unnamed protein product [Acanthoscelides obtectus]|nr:unnamed protein product [Acanthoscelides obtectus]CAK1652429.1 hypothetical protein AOBTE_LOCUS17836 [Acanthoscelides obtectus]